MRRLKELYDTLDTATTPATVLLPWLPGPSAIRRLLATKRIYDIINGTLSERMEKGIVRDDTPQMLINAGDERLIIIGVSVFTLHLDPAFTVLLAAWPSAARHAQRHGVHCSTTLSLTHFSEHSSSWASLWPVRARQGRRVRVLPWFFLIF